MRWLDSLKHIISAYAFCFLLRARPPSNPWPLLCHLFGPWLKQTCIMICGLPWWLSGKESACQCRRCGFDPWVRKIPWRRKWQPTPVFLPGESHGQRSLAGDSPWGQRVGHDSATKQQFCALWKYTCFIWPPLWCQGQSTYFSGNIIAQNNL